MNLATDLSLWGLVANASVLVQLVLALLLVGSLVSWWYIFLKMFSVKKAIRQSEQFEHDFWSGSDLNTLFQRTSSGRYEPGSMERIFEAGFRELVSSMTEPSLRQLHCWDMGLTSESVIAIANSPSAVSLTHLGLNDNQIGPAGAEALANSPYLRALRWLDSSLNAIGERGAQALLHSPLLDQLRYLSINRNDVPASTRNAFRKRRVNMILGLYL